MPLATLQLARTFSTLTWIDVPAPVRRETERLLLDTLGCLLAGADTEIGPIARRFGLALGGSAPVFVAGGPRLGLLGAIYANARIANVLDLDETHPVGVYFSVGAGTAALGLAEARMQSGAVFLNAILIGYKLGSRLASQIRPMIEVEDGRVTGFPSVWGVAAPVVLAAAGATVRLLDQDEAGRAMLPVMPETIAAFIDAQGETKALATLERYRSSIASLHRGAGLPNVRRRDRATGGGADETNQGMAPEAGRDAQPH